MATNSPSNEVRHIERFLQRVRRRYWWMKLLQGLTDATLGLFVLGILLAVGLYFSSPNSLVRTLWFIGVGLGGVYLGYVLIRSYQQLRDEPLAREVEGWEPRAYGFLTALELGRNLSELEQRPLYSPQLASARIQQVSKAIQPLRPLEMIPQRPLRQRAHLLFAAAAFFFLALGLFPHQVSRVLHSFVYPPHQAESISAGKDPGELLVSDLRVMYMYPSYTRRSPRVIPNSDGSLSSLKGTEAKLEARAIFPIREAELLLNNKQSIVFQVGKDQRSISGRLQLLRPGFYRFQLTDLSGKIHLGPPHSIQVVKDKYPKIRLLAPSQDVKDLKLRERASLPIAYKFSDDFGVSKVSLVYRNVTKNQKKPTVEPLRTFEENPRGGSDQTEWNLNTTAFAPGDRIAFQVEVLDNDTITGPKRTRSETRYLTIYSPLENHDKLLEAQEKLLRKFVHILGDILEPPDVVKAPISTVKQHLFKLHTRGRDTLTMFQTLLPKLREDPLTKPYALIALNNIQLRYQMRHEQRASFVVKARTPRFEFPREGYGNQLKKEEEPQEDDVYAFTLLLNRQRLDLIQQLSRKLSNANNRLTELLDKFRKSGDEKTRKALMQEMRRMERLIRQVQRRMQKLSRQIPDEYLNMQAFKNRSSLRTINRMRKMVEDGNLEKAAKELARLARQVERMASQMDEYSKEAGSGAVRKLNTALKKLIDDVHQLEKKQSRLSERNQKVLRRLNQRMQQALKKKMEAMVKKQVERIQQIRKHLDTAEKSTKPFERLYRYQNTYGTLKETLHQLEKMLKTPDLHEAVNAIRRHIGKNSYLKRLLGYQQRNDQMILRFQGKRARPAQKERVERTQKARTELNQGSEIAKKIERDLERFFPKSKPFMNPQDKQLMQKFQKLQKQLNQQGGKIRKKMGEMAKKLPMFKPQVRRQLEEALREMQGASQRLGQREPRPAQGHQQRAVSKLKGVRKQLRQSMQPQKKQRGKGKSGQSRGRRREKIEIPKASDHKAPKALRQDILDAMKEKVPRRYQERVRRYYEKLVK